MGKRKISIKESVAESIAEIAWYIESKGMMITAERFSDSVYDFLQQLSDDRKSYRICKEPERAVMGFRCLPFKRKYTVVFLETKSEITICEFSPSKLIRW
jgi:plasmid stabilization system protein ParE